MDQTCENCGAVIDNYDNAEIPCFFCHEQACEDCIETHIATDCDESPTL